MNNKQKDIETFGENNKIGYVLGNIALLATFVVLAVVAGVIILR